MTPSIRCPNPSRHTPWHTSTEVRLRLYFPKTTATFKHGHRWLWIPTAQAVKFSLFSSSLPHSILGLYISLTICEVITLHVSPGVANPYIPCNCFIGFDSACVSDFAFSMLFADHVTFCLFIDYDFALCFWFVCWSELLINSFTSVASCSSPFVTANTLQMYHNEYIFLT